MIQIKVLGSFNILILAVIMYVQGFCHNSVGKESTATQETPFRFLGCKVHWRRNSLPTPVFLGFPVAQLVKNLPAMWETWVQSLGWDDPLEKGKATHSSILAWRIPLTV